MAWARSDRNALRETVVRSPESVRVLAKRHGLSPTTIQKWRQAGLHALPVKRPRRRSASPDEEAVFVAFRLQSRLPLDDCLFALRLSLPHLSRSALHRCFQRNGVSRLPPPTDISRETGDSCGNFRFGLITMPLSTGPACMFLAVDRVSQLLFARGFSQFDTANLQIFLAEMREYVPYPISKLVIDGKDDIMRGTIFEGREHIVRPAPDSSNGSICPDPAPLIEDRRLETRGEEYERELAELCLALKQTTDVYNRTRKIKSIGGIVPLDWVRLNITGAVPRVGEPPNLS
jgi:hypothetical protein